MKVILTQDVDSLGTSGEVLEVARGHARNYLIPKNLAKKATPSIVKHYEEREKAIANKIAKEVERAQEEASKLEEKVINILARVGEEGKLYGTITNREIATALNEQHDYEVDRKKVVIPQPIKVVGEHEVLVKVHSRVKAKLKVIVENEAGDEEPEVEEEIQVEEAQVEEAQVEDAQVEDEEVAVEA